MIDIEHELCHDSFWIGEDFIDEGTGLLTQWRDILEYIAVQKCAFLAILDEDVYALVVTLRIQIY
jgi:hypothetical protein